jgi:hypothetical protein
MQAPARAGVPAHEYAPCEPIKSSTQSALDVTPRHKESERNDVMSTQSPWYSTRPVATKYHDNTRCIEGNNIEDRNLAHGKAKLPLCRRCAELDAEDK